MPIQVASNFLPKNGAKWPVLEDIYVKGGMRVVADAAARDAIVTDSTAKLCLKTGMFVITAVDNRVWQYIGSGSWQEFKPARSFTFDQLEPAAQWNIQHNKDNQNFTYALFDSDGFQILPDELQIVDSNNLTVYFTQPVSGHITITFN